MRAKTRNTRQRRIILEEMRGARTHPTADQVYAMVRRKLPRISLGTIYRNLDLLAGSGEIRKIEAAGKQRRFDGNVEEHRHVRCVGCGRIEDVPASAPLPVESSVRRRSTYEILGGTVEYTGLCPKCGGRWKERRRG